MALVDIKSTNTFDLTKADRPYDDEEESSEKEAVKYPVSFYKRIKPTHGTLGYAFRNIKGRNDVVIQALKYVTAKNRTTHKFIGIFLILWNNMDEASKRRVDIFDWLCEKYDVNPAKFFGVVQEGLFVFDDLMAQTAISGFTPEFVEIIKRFASKEKGIRDRELFAKIAGLAKDQPLVQLNDNSTKNELNVTVNASLPSFTDTMRKADEGIRTIAPAKPQKALTEGNQDYIDAEIIPEEREKDLATFEKRAEEEFRNLAREL